jgi:hypothetical protein
MKGIEADWETFRKLPFSLSTGSLSRKLIHGLLEFTRKPIPTGRAICYGGVVLKSILEQAINRLNPAIPEAARLEALKTVLSPAFIPCTSTS